MRDPGASGRLGGGLGLLADLLRQGQRQFIEQLQGAGRVAGLQGRLLHRCRFHALADGRDCLGDVGPDDTGGVEPAGVGDDDRSLLDLLDEVEGAGQSLIGGVLPTDDLDQGHLVRRGEEVDADEVLVAVDPGGQFGDRQGRGVRPQDGIGFDDVLDLTEHLLLDRHGLEDGFDDEVDSGEVLDRRARGDPVENGLGLLLGGLALGQSRLLALDRIGLALLGGGELDILEDDLDAGLRRGVGDGRTHHSGSEDPELLDLSGSDTVRAGAAGVDVAEVEEERLDHVLRHRSVGEVDEVPGFDRQRGVDVDARPFDGRGEDRTRGRHRCALGLAAQHRGQPRKHRGQLGRGRGAARDLEALDIPGLSRFGVVLDPGLRPRLEFGGGGEFIDESERLRIGGLELRRGQNRLLQSVLDADHAHRARDASTAGQQTEGDLGEPESCAGVVLCCDPVMCGERDLESAAQCRAVQGGDDGLAEGLESAQHGLHALDLRELRLGGFGARLADLVEVASGEEGLLR